MRSARARAVLAAAFCTIGTAASADPITITSGSVMYLRLNALEVVFRSPISLDFFAGTDSENWPPPYETSPHAGSMLNVSATEPEVSGFFTLGGTDYEGTGSFSIASRPVAVPTLASELATATTPFRFFGTFNGQSAAGVSQTLALRGRGTASVTFGPSSRPGRTDWFQSIYDFDQFSSTPEPSTILLLGSAMALIGRRLRRGIAVKPHLR
jgi:hypothetical protein